MVFDTPDSSPAYPDVAWGRQGDSYSPNKNKIKTAVARRRKVGVGEPARSRTFLETSDSSNTPTLVSIQDI